jgi:hypothetical protein
MALHQQCHGIEQCHAACKRKNATKSTTDRCVLRLLKTRIFAIVVALLLPRLVHTALRRQPTILSLLPSCAPRQNSCALPAS